MEHGGKDELFRKVEQEMRRAPARLGVERICTKHGLSKKRVLGLVEKGAKDERWKQYGAMPGAGNDPFCVGLYTCGEVVKRAIEAMGPKEGMKFLMKGNIADLGEKVLMAQSLANPECPLYTVEELAGIAEAFLRHCDDNRELFVKAGYPRTTFGASPWLDLSLNRLYHVRRPKGRHAHPCDFGTHSLDCCWSRDAQWAPTGFKAAEYGKCPLIVGLRSEAAARLEGLREKMFDLRQGILKELGKAAKAGTAGGLWKTCVRKFADAELKEEDADFLVQMDKFYVQMDKFYVQMDKFDGGLLRPMDPIWGRADHCSGGMTSILQVVGHYEHEMMGGPFAQVRATLGELIEHDELKRPRLKVKNYFEVIGKSEQAMVDKAIVQFISLSAQEDTYWTDYRRRIKEDVEKVLLVEPKVGLVRKEFAPEIESFLSKMCGFAVSTRELTGKLPDTKGMAVFLKGPEAARGEYVFRKTGDFWQIRYEGVDVGPLKDSKGLHYIAVLLAHPEKVYTLGQLAMEVDKVTPSVVSQKYAHIIF